MSYGGVFNDDWDQYWKGAAGGITKSAEAKIANNVFGSNPLTLQGNNCRKFTLDGTSTGEQNVLYLVKDSSYDTSGPLELSMLYRFRYPSLTTYASHNEPSIHLRAAINGSNEPACDQYYQVLALPIDATPTIRYIVTGMVNASSNLYWFNYTGVARFDFPGDWDDWNFLKARIEANGANQRIKVWVAHGQSNVDLADEVVAPLAIDVEHVNGSVTPTIHTGTATGTNWSTTTPTTSGRLGFACSASGASGSPSYYDEYAGYLDSIRVANS